MEDKYTSLSFSFVFLLTCLRVSSEIYLLNSYATLWCSRAPSTAMLDIYKEGLNDIISINSLFTSAVFIGLSFSNVSQTLETREECKPDAGIAKRLVVYEVVSFGFFLLSTLIAKTLKLHLYIIRNKHNTDFLVNSRRFMLVMSTVGTLVGCAFLTLSMINVAQIRLGKLTCSGASWVASGSLVVLFTLALIFWLPSLIYSQRIAWKIQT